MLLALLSAEPCASGFAACFLDLVSFPRVRAKAVETFYPPFRALGLETPPGRQTAPSPVPPAAVTTGPSGEPHSRTSAPSPRHQRPSRRRIAPSSGSRAFAAGVTPEFRSPSLTTLFPVRTPAPATCQTTRTFSSSCLAQRPPRWTPRSRSSSAALKTSLSTRTRTTDRQTATDLMTRPTRASRRPRWRMKATITRASLAVSHQRSWVLARRARRATATTRGRPSRATRARGLVGTRSRRKWTTSTTRARLGRASAAGRR